MRQRRPARRARLLRGALIVAVAAVGATACQSADATAPGAPGDVVAAPSAPQADVDAIRTTIDAVNATAGGAVADQQAQLVALVDPARRDEVRRCPAATTTVRLEPVDQGLRELPAGSPATTPTDSRSTVRASDTATTDATTTVAGARTYALPTLIRIFSGDRLVGTDLTTLQLIVRPVDNDTEAYLTPFCVN